jgi:peptidoglycan hydrolase CwlO-like protein
MNMMKQLTTLLLCLITSLLSFSQTDTDSLICIPSYQIRQAAIELTEYDFCKTKRDSLQSTIGDLSQIISNKDSIIELETTLKETAFFTIDSLGTTISTLNTEVDFLEEDNDSLKKERNILRGIIVLLGTVFSIAI